MHGGQAVTPPKSLWRSEPGEYLVVDAAALQFGPEVLHDAGERPVGSTCWNDATALWMALDSRPRLTPWGCGRSVVDVVLLVSRRHVDLGRLASAL